MKKKEKSKSQKPIKNKQSENQSATEVHENTNGGLPDMDFKKLMGCGG